MGKWVLLFTAMLFYSVSYGQPARELDSLLKVLDTHQEDSNVMLTLRRIGSQYIDNNATKAIGYFERSIELAKKLKDRLRQANGYYDLGFCYLLKGNYDQSLDYYQQSEKIYAELNDKRRLTNAYISIGNVFFQNKNFDKSNSYYNNAEALVLQTKDTGQLSTFYSQRGMVYDQLRQYDTALVYLRKSLALARAIGQTGLVANGLVNIALSLKHKNNTAAALQYLDSAMQVYKTLPNVPLDNVAATYNNIAATQAQAGNFATAQATFNKSIEYAKQAGVPGIVMENYRNMADMFGNRKDYKEQSLYLVKYHALKDSLFSNDSKNRLTQLEADYQLEKKNTSLAKQAAETNRQKGQRNFFVMIALGAILLLGTLAFFYQRIRQSNRLLQDKNRQINQQRDELQALNQVKDRLFSVISHDLRNPLATLKSYLSLVGDTNMPAEQLERFRQKTILSVSQTSHLLDNLLTWANMQLKNSKASITPVNLSDCIEDALGAVVAQAAEKHIQLQKDIQATTAMGEHAIVEIALRNLATNAVKFSYPNSVISIGTMMQNGKVLLTVKDNGMGMTKAQVTELLKGDIESTMGTAGEKGSGLGLFLVKELLHQIDASLHIQSELGKGSTFSIELLA